jgi:hypothetical protein
MLLLSYWHHVFRGRLDAERAVVAHQSKSTIGTKKTLEPFAAPELWAVGACLCSLQLEQVEQLA